MRELIGPTLLLSFLYSLGACSGPVEPTSHAVAGSAQVPAVTAPAAPARTIALDRDLTPGETDPKRATQFFVWAREGEERTVTYELDSFGRKVAQHDGIVIATRAGTWQWQVESRAVHTIPCEYTDDEGHVFAGEPTEPGTATHASLLGRSSEAEQVIVDPGVDLMGNAHVSHDVGVIGSVGPYLFLEETTYVDSCGAHGFSGVSTTIWNAETGTTVAPPMDLGELKTPRTLAIADLVDEDDEMFQPTEENVELTEILPRFGKDGALVVGLQFTAPTCYACTRGGWSSYTKSTLVDAPAIPEILSPFASAPAPVRAFLRANPDVAMNGWSAR
ncbi:MAG: hypothetical protein ABW133_05755 [Polyangiaceae bacterium]